MRVSVTAVLAEPFGVLDPDLRSTMRRPVGLTLEIFIDSVLSKQPVPLAGVAGKHLPLFGKDTRDVDVEFGWHGPAVAIGPL